MDYTYPNKDFIVQTVRRPDEPKIPKSKRGICGAKTRTGTPCNAPPVWNKVIDKARNGRCKMHGGLSTGPKTEEGRQAIRNSVIASNRNRWRTEVK
ncbi:MAG: HGGxSTG domain-containing protein [Legionellaceae bacterium]|nr:HGGxSTG domain-containing protein [Legionellaceae bacterium]